MKRAQGHVLVVDGVSNRGKFCQLARIFAAGLLLGLGSGSTVGADSQAGTVVAWRNNTYGQTTLPEGLTNVLAISAGQQQGLALKADGTVVAWGRDVSGLKSVPPGLSNVITIAIGLSNAMALQADGDVVVWGRNSFGPVSVPAGLTNMVAVAGSFGRSLVLRADGILFTWGSLYPDLTAVQSNVVVSSGSIAQGACHSLALTRAGTVLAWGDNSSGQCNVPADLTNAVGVAAGSRYSLAVKDDGTVVGWGNVTVPADLTNVVEITAGFGQTLVLKADGTVAGLGSTGVPAGLTNVVAIASGGDFCLALVGDGPPVLKAAATDLQRGDESLSVSVPTQSGRVYQLEYSGSLTASNWEALPLVPGTGGPQTFTDPSLSGTQRFYRVRRW